MSEKRGKYNEDIDIDVTACSTTDCTGLIPSLPQSQEEWESYKDLIKYEAEPGKEGTE